VAQTPQHDEQDEIGRILGVVEDVPVRSLNVRHPVRQRKVR